MRKYLLIICLLFQAFAYAQNRQLPRLANMPANDAYDTTSPLNFNQQRVMSTCSDKVNYVGNVYGTPEQCGGLLTYQPYLYFQVYPGFNGTVTRIDVRATKIAGNVNAQIILYNINNNNEPVGTPIATANVNINGSWAEYGANFSSAANVSGGFAAAIFAPLLSDSFIVACSPNNSQVFGNNTFAYDDGNGFIHPVAGSKDLIIRPTISFNMPTANLNVTPNSACFGTSISFLGGSSALPVHFNNSMYNTQPYNSYLDFGDGSPVNNGGSAQHAYATSGTKVSTYTIEYDGWNSTCVAAATQNVTVNPAANSSFTYGTSNLLLTLVNNSTDATSYNWNFGDLTTSTLQNPPVHDYSLTQGAGTYVVELVTTGVCGNGYQATTITVAQGTSTGLTEAKFDENIYVFPNPATSSVTIGYELLKNDGSMEVSIADALGRIVKTKCIQHLPAGSLYFDLADLSPGTYFVKLSSDKGNKVRTFVKQ